MAGHGVEATGEATHWYSCPRPVLKREAVPALPANAVEGWLSQTPLDLETPASHSACMHPLETREPSHSHCLMGVCTLPRQRDARAGGRDTSEAPGQGDRTVLMRLPVPQHSLWYAAPSRNPMQRSRPHGGNGERVDCRAFSHLRGPPPCADEEAYPPRYPGPRFRPPPDRRGRLPSHGTLWPEPAGLAPDRAGLAPWDALP
jgi:hypothetical protein